MKNKKQFLIKKLLLPMICTFLFMTFTGIVHAGIVVSSGTSMVVAGSTYVTTQGNCTIKSSGTLTNNGTIRLSGDFTNEGTATVGSGKIEFNGTAPQYIKGTTTTQFGGVTINNSSASTELHLSQHAKITGTLDFELGNLDIGNFNLTLAAVTNAVAGKHIVTSGSGMVTMNVTTAKASVTIPVGYGPGTGTYAPVTIANPNVNSYFSVKVEDGLLDGCGSGTPITNDVVTVGYNIVAASATTADITLGWASTEEGTGFDRTSCAVMGCNAAGYTPLAAMANGSAYSITASNASLASTWFGIGDKDKSVILSDLKVFLQGPYAGTGAMNTTLRTSGLVPTAQPYSAVAFDGTNKEYDGTESITPLPATIVDWVLVEIRNSTTLASKVATQPALLLADGRVVSYRDGSSYLRFDGLSPGNYYVVVHHRNHLSIMTSSPHALAAAHDTPTLYDYTTAANKAYGSSAMKANGDGTFSMFATDGYVDNQATASDNNVWKADNGNINVYYLTDFNMDGQVSATDQSVWKVNNGNISKVPF